MHEYESIRALLTLAQKTFNCHEWLTAKQAMWVQSLVKSLNFFVTFSYFVEFI